VSERGSSVVRAASHPAAAALLVAAGYYAGANFGLMMRLPPATPSVLWPPNTILTAALLMSPPGRWWVWLVAALPAHLVAELSMAWPLPLVLALFMSNASQALIAAAGARAFSDAPARFDTLRRVVVFILAVGLLAPFASSFPDAAAVTTFQGEPYWVVWRTRFFSNVLTELVLGPAIIMALTAAPAWIRDATRQRKVEAILLAAALVLVGGWAFGVTVHDPRTITGGSAVVFLLPLVLLAAVRFGPGGASLALLVTTVIAIWAATHGRGPFTGLTLVDAVLSLQILLSAMAIPVLCLAAVIVERRQATRVLAEQLRLEALLSRLAAGFVRLPSHEIDPILHVSLRHLGEVTGVDRVVLYRQFDSGGRRVRYAWSTPGSDREPIVLPEQHFPWSIQRLRSDEVVVFSDLEDLPTAAAEDVESFRRQDIRSGLVVPLIGPRARGALGLLSVSGPREWPDGQVQWLRVVAEIFASALARKEAEDALRASELSKSAILASLDSSVAVLDQSGCIIDVNARWARAAAGPRALPPTGARVDANLLQVWEAATDEPTARVPEAVAGVRDVLAGRRSGFALEYSTRGASGERWFLMGVVRLERPEGGAVVSCTEITEHKRAELDAQRSRQELAHFSRLSTMGQLTASLAHELNQPLAGILTNARAGLRFLDAARPDLDEIRAILIDIVADDKRAGEVIQRVRDLLRKGEPKHVLLDLNTLVQDVVRLLSSDAIIRSVSIRLELAPEPVLVYGDRVELQQVMLNLLLNAMEAVTAVADGDRAVSIATEHTTRDTAHVIVRDSGAGLPAGPQDLFEPFFTTKPANMGMGLAIARAIVESHRGAIWAKDNDRGGGAAFHFALPTGPKDAA
jgi:two-component system, LuxR family, sensor kinase FixL